MAEEDGAWGSLLDFGDGDALLTLVWILPLIVFVFYGQRIQLYITSGEISKKISELERYSAESRSILLDHAAGAGGADRRRELGRLVEHFTIAPVDMDPAGIVDKVRHVIRLRDDSTRAHIGALYPGLDAAGIARIQAMAEAASALYVLHRTVRHMFLTAKRQNNYPLILPLQMVLPFIMEQAEGLRASADAFGLGQPIGDGAGPMAVGSMMRGAPKEEAAHQTVSARLDVDGRDVLLIKAAGPQPTVGRLDDALASAVSEAPPAAIITVDAALKLEGEDSGRVVRGFGAAMGGSGAERFAIEEAATRARIPLHSVIVTESAVEALSPMTAEIARAAGEAAERVREIIRDSAARGERVIVMGVGNTSGVLQ